MDPIEIMKAVSKLKPKDRKIALKNLQLPECITNKIRKLRRQTSYRRRKVDIRWPRPGCR